MHLLGLGHDFEEYTRYCKKCGCSEPDYEKGFRPKCDLHGNVTGISHIIAMRRIDALMEPQSSTSQYSPAGA